MKKDVQLNALLCQAVTAEEIDFPLVEKLLKAGADPIGRCSEEDEDENAFGEALVNAQGNGNDYYSVDLKWAAQLPKENWAEFATKIIQTADSEEEILIKLNLL